MAKPQQTQTKITEAQATPAATSAPTESTALTTPPPTHALVELDDYGDDAGAGYEGQTSADTAVPFLTFLQSGSPACKRGDAKYVEGAQESMIYNPLTGRLFDGDKGVVVVPVYTERVFAEYKPNRGGFQGKHKPDSDVVRAALAASKEFGVYSAPNGNDLAETVEVYALLVEDEGAGEAMPVLIGLQSTAIKPFRYWNTALRNYEIVRRDGTGKVVARQKPPLFANLTRITTKYNKNTQGSWYSPSFAPARGDIPSSLLKTTSPLFERARAFKELLDLGHVTANYETQERGAGGGTDDAADAAF